MTRPGQIFQKRKKKNRAGLSAADCQQSTSARAAFTCVFVCWFVGLCAGRRVSCHSIHAAPARAHERPTRSTLPLCEATAVRSTWAGRKSECLNDVTSCASPPPGFVALRVHLCRLAKKNPNQSKRWSAFSDWVQVASCHTLLAGAVLLTLRVEALLWLFPCSL